jgi:catechol 2,3-dioxygenase-like lactoylglutathione lyase family enzyme
MAQQTDFETRRAELAARYLVPEADRPPSTGRGVHHLALICSDVEQIAYLGPDRGIEESVYFRDPDGIQIELTKDPLYEMLGGRLGRDGSAS